MAVAFLIEAPDMTLAQYDVGAKEVHPDGHLPSGCLYHVAGSYDGGVRVVDVWESREAFDTFVREQLGPAMAKLGSAPPRIQTWPVHNILKP